MCVVFCRHSSERYGESCDIYDSLPPPPHTHTYWFLSKNCNNRPATDSKAFQLEKESRKKVNDSKKKNSFFVIREIVVVGVDEWDSSAAVQGQTAAGHKCDKIVTRDREKKTERKTCASHGEHFINKYVIEKPTTMTTTSKRNVFKSIAAWLTHARPKHIHPCGVRTNERTNE